MISNQFLRNLNYKKNNMKIKLQFLAAIILLSLVSNAQYQTGKKTITYTDPDRNNRQIETVIYYPSTTGGTDAAIASGQFPAIIFGHGTAMADPNLYLYFLEALPTYGYIVLFPTTESASPPIASPNHEAFGLDLKFLNLKIKSENTNSGSLFFNHVTDKTAIIGHSLGGKATLIGAANNNEVTTIVTLCAALSNPPWPYGGGYDAITNSIPYITVPSLVVDAEFDCVVESDAGRHLTYELLNVDCKTYVSINGGGHCYMASSDASSCETAEGWMGGNCESSFTISREQQNQTVLDILLPYFGYYLLEDEASYSEFLCYITTSNAVISERSCDLPDAEISGIDINNVVEDITVPYGTSLSTATNLLAQQITIDDIYGVTHNVNLSWSVSGYNGNIAGDYNASGNFNLPACIVQTSPPTNLNVEATITVEENTSGIPLLQINGISLYPNPISDFLFYDKSEISDDNYLEIYNIYGELILREYIENKGSINLSNLSSGMYMIKVRDSYLKLIKN